MADADELRAICLAVAISDGDVRERLYGDYYRKYDGEPWIYIAQEASNLLIGVMAGILANYAYAKLVKSESEITVNDLFTREIDDGIVRYRKAVDRLREHRVRKEASQKHVDIVLMESDRVIKVLESQDLGSIDLLELLEEVRSLSKKELESRAKQFDR